MGLGLTEKRTAIEALSIKQIIDSTHIQVKWVNSDRQLADILTKQGVLPDNLDRALKTNKWRIVLDATFTSVKNLRTQKREGHVRNLQQDCHFSQKAVQSKTIPANVKGDLL